MSADLELLAQLNDETQPVFDKIEARVDQFGNTVGGSSGEFNAMQVAGVTAFTAIAAAATATAVAVGAVVVEGTKQAISLEQQMADVAAVMNVAKDAVEPLKETVMGLAVDPRLRVNVTQAADAVQMLARNGLNMREIMEGAALGTVALSNATGGAFAESADLMTDIMSVFKIEAQDMERAINGVVSVTTNSKFAINDYVLAFASAGGVARAAGVDFEDFNIALAGMSPIFSSGRTAGTSFKVMLQRLIPASKEATELMMELGLMTADGSNQFFDAQGNLRGMGEIAEMLRTSLGGLTEEQRNLALATLFGTDASRAAIGLMEMGADGFDRLKETMGETSAFDSAATRMDTVAGAIDILRSLTEGFTVQIGDAFLPVVRLMVELLLDFAEDVGPAIVGVFQLVGDTIGGISDRAAQGWPFLRNLVATLLELGVSANTAVSIVSLVRTLGELWSFVTGLISPLASLIGQYLSWEDAAAGLLGVLRLMAVAVLPLITPALTAIAAVAAPVISSFLALTAVSAGLRLVWENDLLGIRTLVENVFGVITEVLGAFWSGAPTDYPWHDIFPDWLADIALEFSHIFEGLTTLIGDFNDGIVGVDYPWEDIFPDWLADTIYTVVGAITDFADVWDASVTAVFDLIEARGDLFADFWDALLGLFESGDFGQFFDDIAVAFADFATRLEEIATEWSEVFLEWAGADSWLELAEIIITEIINGLGSFIDSVGDLLEGWSEAFLEWAGADSWGELAEMALESLSSAFWDGVDFISDILEGWSESFLEWADADTWSEVPEIALDLLVDGFWGFVDLIGDVLEGWSDAIFEWAEADTWWDVAEAAAEAIAEGFEGAVDWIDGVITAWGEAFLEWADVDTWGEMGEVATQLINDGFVAALDSLAGAAEAIVEWLTSSTQDNADTYEAIGNFIIDAIAVGLLAVGGLVAGAFELATTVAQAILDGLASLEGWLIDNAPIWWGALVEFATSHDWLGMAAQVAQNILDGLSAFGAGAAASLGEWFNYFLVWATGSDWAGLVTKITTAISNFLKAGAANMITGGLAGWLGHFTAWVKRTDFRKIGFDITTAVIKGLEFFKTTVPRTLSTWWDAFRSWFASLPTKLSAAIKTLLIKPITTESTKSFKTEWPKVVSEWWKKIKESIDKAKGQMIKRGQDMVAGIVEGIRSAASAVWGAIQELAGGASDAMSAANEAQSPSRLYMRHGKDVGQGYALGIQAMFGLVGNAGRGLANAANTGFSAASAGTTLDPFSGVNTNSDALRNFGQNLGVFINQIQNIVTVYKTEYLEKIQLFLDVAEQAANIVPLLLQALGAMSQFSEIGHVAPHVQAFARHMQTIVDAIAQSVTHSTEVLEQTQLYVETASNIADLVEPGIAALQELKRWEPLVAGEIVPSIANFATSTGALVAHMLQAANNFSENGLAHASTYAETVGKISNIVEPAITALHTLSTWQADNIWFISGQMADFANQTGLMVFSLARVAANFSGGILEHTSAYAETIGTISNIVRPAITALQELSSWNATSISAIVTNAEAFAQQTAVLVSHMAAVADGFSNEMLGHTSTFADTVGKVAGMIRPAIDAFQEISEYASFGSYEISTKALRFRNELWNLMNRMNELAGNWSTAVLEHTQVFAQTVVDVSAMIRPAIDALQEISEYASFGSYEISTKALRFRNELWNLMDRMNELAGNWAPSVLEHTSLFAKTVTDVTGMIGPAIDALGLIAAYVEFNSAIIASKAANFTLNLKAFLQEISIAATDFTTDGLSHVSAFTQAVKSIVELVEPAINALGLLMAFALPLTAEMAQKMYEFRILAAEFVIQFASALNSFTVEYDIVASATAMASAVSAVVNIVEPTLNAILLLANSNIEISSELATKFYEFRILAAEFVIQFADALNSFTVEYDIVASAIAMASAVSAVVGVVEPALNAILLLANSNIEVTTELAQKFYEFRILAAEFVIQFAMAAESIGVGGMNAATDAASAVSSVIAIVKPTLEALALIGSYVADADLENQILLFVDDLVLIAQMLTDGLTEAEGLALESVAEAAELAKEIKTLLSVVKTGISALTAINGFTGVAGLETAVSLFTADLLTVTVAIRDALIDSGMVAGGAVGDAADLAKEIKTLLGVVKTGLSAVALLSDYIPQTGLRERAELFGNDLLEVFQGLLDAFETAGLQASEMTSNAASLAKDIKGTLSVVKTGLVAITQLSDYTAGVGLRENTLAFAADLLVVFGTLHQSFIDAGLVASESTSNASDLAKDIKGVIGIVKGGVDAVLQIGSFTGIDNAETQAQLFADNLLDVFIAIQTAITDAGLQSTAATQAAADFAKDVKALVGIVKPGIDAINELALYIPASGIEEATRNFAADILAMANELFIALRDSTLATQAGISQAADLAKEVKSLIGIVKPGIAAISELGSYVRREGLDQAAQNFAADILLLAGILLDALIDSGILVTRLVENAGALAKELKAIIGIVKPGIDALEALAEFTGGSVSGGAQDFADAVILLATILLDSISESESLTGSSITQAANLAGDMEDLLKTVKPGVDALMSLGEYTSNEDAVGTIQQFADDLVLIAQTLTDTLIFSEDTVSTDALQAATDFAQSVADISDNLREAIDAFQDIAHSETPSTTRVLNYITAQARTISDSLSDASGDVNTTAVEASAVFAANLEAALASLEAALASLQGMAEANTPESLTTLLQQIFDIFMQSAPDAQAAGASVGQALAAGTQGGLEDGQGDLTNALLTIINHLINQGSNQAEGGDAIGSILAIFLGDGMQDEQGSLISTIGSILTAVLGDAENTDTDFRDVGQLLINILGVGMGNREGSLINTIGSILTAVLGDAENTDTDFRDVGQLLINILGVGMGNRESSLLSVLGSLIGSSISQLEGDRNQFQNVGEDYINRVGTGADSRESSLLNVFGLLIVAALASLAGYLSQYEDYGENTTKEIVDGVNIGKSDVIIAYEDVAVEGVNAISTSTIRVQYKNAGKDLVDEMILGAQDGEAGYITEINSIAQAGASSAESGSNYNAYYDAGAFLVQGLTAGANSQRTGFVEEIGSIVDEGLVSANTAAQNASPSKRAMQISHDIVRGLEIPIKEADLGVVFGNSINRMFAGVSTGAAQSAQFGSAPPSSVKVEQHLHLHAEFHGSLSASDRAEIERWVDGELSDKLANKFDDMARETETRIRNR